ncbi:hypothetical protein GC207_03765 [bacterium]|nr:hypothetical protein [bacterium]
MNAVAGHLWTYLVAQSGHLILIFGIVWVLCRLLRKASAHWRYLLWLLVLAKCFLPPMVSVPLPSSYVDALPVAVERAMTLSNSNGAGFATGDSARSAAAGAGAIWSITSSELVGIIWAVGAGAFLLTVVGRALKIQRDLRRHRTEPDMELECEFVRLAQLSGLKNRPRLCLIVGISQPFVWGLARGCIYLPMHFSSQGTVEQRRLVLAHELAHVVRWDALANALQIVVQAVFWFHPLVWWLNRLLRHEREKCCDEMAIALLKVDSRAYGSAIVERVAAFYERACPSSSLAISGKAKDLEDRLRSLMIPGRSFYRRPSLAAFLAVALLGCLTLPAGFGRTQTDAAKATNDSRFMLLELPDAGVRSGEAFDLEGLAYGRHEFGGISFQTIAPVALNGGELNLKSDSLANCRELHLLHGVRGRLNDGETVARVLWRYADGKVLETAINYGEQVRDCWFWNYEPVSDPGSAMAWTGSNPAVRAQGGSLRLYRTSLENPRPDSRLLGITLRGANTEHIIPFVAGATAQLGHP